jgi:transposase
MWKFDGTDVMRLRRAVARATQLRLFKRLQAVLLVAEGQSPRQVAALTGQRRWNLYHWIDRYRRRRRPQDLADRPRPGRPRVAESITPARIRRELSRDPLELGHMSTEWTVPLLARHLRRACGCAISSRTLRRRLRAMGLAWKRPRYVYHPADPHLGQKKGR